MEIERRVHKELRALAPEKEIILRDTGTCETQIARVLLERVSNGRRNIIVEKDPRGPAIRPTNLEHEATVWLDAILEEREIPRDQVLMCSVPEAMLRDFAAREGITLPLLAHPNTDARRLIDTLQTQHVQTLSALRKSFARLRKNRTGAPQTR